MEELHAEHIILIGDTHTLRFVDILEHYKLENFIMIGVGDHGEMGSDRTNEKYLNGLQKYCNLHNGRILIVRGNHSDIAFFTENHWANKNYSRISFLPDYTYKLINGKVFLFAGGAISIDRQLRIEGIDYWKDEGFVLPSNYEDLPPCDVLITHSAPSDVLEYEDLTRISGWFKNDPTLKEELIEERRLIRKLYEHVNCRCVFGGHFHVVSSVRIDGTWFRVLDINEVLDITRDI